MTTLLNRLVDAHFVKNITCSFQLDAESHARSVQQTWSNQFCFLKEEKGKHCNDYNRQLMTILKLMGNLVLGAQVRGGMGVLHPPKISNIGWKVGPKIIVELQKVFK